jgi:hypothetical protein
MPGAFDGTRTATVAAWWVGMLTYFGDRVRESLVKVFRG